MAIAIIVQAPPITTIRSKGPSKKKWPVGRDSMIRKNCSKVLTVLSTTVSVT